MGKNAHVMRRIGEISLIFLKVSQAVHQLFYEWIKVFRMYFTTPKDRDKLGGVDICRLLCNGFTGAAHIRSNCAVCGPAFYGKINIAISLSIVHFLCVFFFFF